MTKRAGQPGAGPRERDPRDGPGLPPSVLRGVAAREPAALEVFFAASFDLVYGLAHRLAGPDLCEDITQEVFFKVHRAAHQLDPGRDPRYWLTAITYNTCREFWRSNAHRSGQRTVSLDDAPAGARIPDAALRPDEERLRSEREAAVQEAILELPENLRAAVLLHDYQGLGHEEVATITGVTHVAARKRYSRALAELARRLEGKLK